MSITRRQFMRSSLAAAAFAGVDSAAQSEPSARPGPVVISSGNGLAATALALDMIANGADALDAVIAGVNIVELDPKDHSVGYGGLPNELGVVELDSSVMHGPTHNAGAVAALRGIKTPSKVARLVMERTDHVLLVGQGALDFAKAHGFEEENLLTDEARRIWLRWKEEHSDRDDWLAPPEDKSDQQSSRRFKHLEFTYGTINCNALDLAGNLSGVTTTSGLSYKLPGRVGDSPLIGCGLYVDNEIGAAGSTGRGEAVIVNNGAFSVVEQMRNGKTPTEACLEVLKRIAERNHLPHLKREDGKPNFNVKFYAINKQGDYGGAALWSGGEFAIANADGNRLEECAFLYKREQ